MPGLGRKTWSPGDTLTASDVNGYLMDQSVMVFAGTAARASAIPTPSAGMVAYSTATQLQVYNGSAWVDLSTGYGVASGGTGSPVSVTISGTDYQYLVFTSTGTLTVTKSGLFDVMLCAGGGGGGSYQSTANQGGGGAGGLVRSTIYLNANQTVTIGAGGAARAKGSESTIGSTTVGSTVAPIAVGGGLGGDSNGYGGSAGGGQNNYPSFAGVTGQGNASGSGPGLGDGNGAAGGGGAGGVGANGTGSVGGNGGAGFDVSAFIGGSALFKSGGGGGGRYNGSPGSGGSSIGGAGGSTGAGGTAAANTASGGGGGNGGGAGGSGIVYVRFKV